MVYDWSMQVNYSKGAKAVEDHLYDNDPDAYEHLWEVLERIMEDPEEATYAAWSKYVSTRNLWGSKVPGTDYTVYWRVESDGTVLMVYILASDLGV